MELFIFFQMSLIKKSQPSKCVTTANSHLVGFHNSNLTNSTTTKNVNSNFVVKHKDDSKAKWPLTLSPIRVISMRPERYSFLCRNADTWKRHLILFPATNGTKISKREWIQRGFTNESGAKRLRRGELGCADSHTRAWQLIADDEKQEFGVVAEDDACIVPSAVRSRLLHDTLEELKISAVKWDILYLEYRNVFGHEPRQKSVTKHTFTPKGCQCLYMYVLTRAGAKKLLSRAKPFLKPIDVYVAEMSDSDEIAALCMTPALGKVKNMFSDTTTII